MSREAVSGLGYQAGGLGGGDCPLPGELTGYEQSECRHECEHTNHGFTVARQTEEPRSDGYENPMNAPSGRVFTTTYLHHLR